MAEKPAVSLVAVPGRRRATLDLAQRLEREGFTGIYCPSPGDGLALCEALAVTTREIPFGTSIANIYTRHPSEYAQTAAVVHELSGGRFRFGIGVSHGPAHERLGIRPGKPLDDIRKFVGRPPRRRQAGGRAPAAHARHAAAAHGGAVRGDRAGRGVGQRRALAHGGVAEAPPGDRAARSEVLHRRHGADLHRRRRRGRGRRQPAHAHELRQAAELPELLDRGGLRGRDARGARRDRARGRRRACARRCPTAGSTT